MLSIVYDAKFAVRFSTTASIVIAFIKGITYLWTGSQAVFADWLESIAHICITLLMGVSLWYSAKPADGSHCYGHGKITYYTASIEGIFIASAGICALYSSLTTLMFREPLSHLESGIILEAAIACLNGIVAYYLTKTGRLLRNLAIVANAKHVLADMWTTLGVVISLALTLLTGWQSIDIAVGGLVGVHILWTGVHICYQAYQGLMERTDETMHNAIIQLLNKAVARGCLADYHQLRHRRVNDSIWIEVHMLFEDSLSLKEVHARATAIEMELIAYFSEDHVYITSHLEPLCHHEAHPADYPEAAE